MLPLLLKSSAGLIVGISFGDEGKFLGDVQYDVAKAACTRLNFALATKLRAEGIAVLTAFPGFTRTERVERGATAEEVARMHSPRFVGRAIVALMSDPEVMTRTGTAVKVGQLGLEYGFTDVDGTQPEPYVLPEGHGT